MKNEIFSSDRYFTLFDYSVSHGQLLLRSDKRKGYEDNVDIIFYDTRFVQIYTMLYGIKINLLVSNETQYKSISDYLELKENNLFEIESRHEEYYLAASFIKVFSNNLEFNETNLGDGDIEQGTQIAGFYQ